MPDHIVAYGFDKKFVAVPNTSIKLANGSEITFQHYQTSLDLSQAQGLVLFQGIFESIGIPQYVRVNSWYVTKVDYDHDRLLACMREVKNLLDRHGWVVFLIGSIVDSVPDGLSVKPVQGTDLCRIFLDDLKIGRRIINGLVAQPLRDEFNQYISKFGVAQTRFGWGNAQATSITPLMKAHDHMVGFEYEKRLFFLPCHLPNTGADTAEVLSKAVVEAILTYLRNSSQEPPAWADEIALSEEEGLQKEVQNLAAKLESLNQRIGNLQRYRAILTTKSSTLRDIVADIFENYFSLNIDRTDAGQEDFKIVDSSGKSSVFCEVKATNAGIKRDFINQVDSHRERAGFKSDIPGLLVINTGMDKIGVTERHSTTVPMDQISHAVNMNVLIIRTIDLLYLMKLLEKKSDRDQIVLRLIQSGGGWLRADAEDYQLIKGEDRLSGAQGS